MPYLEETNYSTFHTLLSVNFPMSSKSWGLRCFVMFLIIDIGDDLEMQYRANPKTREWFYMSSNLAATNSARQENPRQKRNSGMFFTAILPAFDHLFG